MSHERDSVAMRADDASERGRAGAPGHALRSQDVDEVADAEAFQDLDEASRVEDVIGRLVELARYFVTDEYFALVLCIVRLL